MTDQPNRPPLWRALKAADASWTSDLTIPEARAIKAMRDYIRHHVPGNGWHTWQVRQLVDLLNTEADRAERGE